jgi:pimeloyl-ACP methyl ester carboxylesterase
MFMRELDNGAVLEAIKVPSLIIQGKDDRVVLSTSSDNIARHIPHASRVDYDHCGHVAFVEAAEEFNRDVAAFMQRIMVNRPAARRYIRGLLPARTAGRNFFEIAL